MSRIKVAVVDDVSDIREYLINSLVHEEDIQVIGEAQSGKEAVSLIREIQPDVVLMDILMETSTAGLDAAEIIHKEFPNIRLIILTIHEDSTLMFHAYCVGAMDYILKTAPTKDIAQAIRETYNNQMMIRPNVATKLVSEFSRMRSEQTSLLFTYNIISKLSNSEFDILIQVYEGKKYKEIADMRFVSQVTIKSQVNSILKKFERKSMKEVLSLLKSMNFEKMIKEIRPDLK